MKAKIPSRFLSSKRSPPWLSTTLKRCFERRDNSLQTAKESICPNHWYKFRQLCNAAIATLTQTKKEFNNCLALSLCHPKSFWGLYRSITSIKQRLLPVLHRCKEEATDTIVKAELLNKQFTSTFTSHVNHQTPWKLSHVIPVFKSKDPADAANYRPISLLSLISKTLECQVFNTIMFHCPRLSPRWESST